jgi:hypothetical protein
MQEVEGYMIPELADRSRSPRGEPPKVRRKKKELEDRPKRQQIQGENGNIAYMNNETGSTLNRNSVHSTTAIAEAGEKAENHR